jgi:hypothetical protein
MADPHPTLQQYVEKGRKEVDPMNIIEGSRHALKPSDRAKGDNYPRAISANQSHLQGKPGKRKQSLSKEPDDGKEEQGPHHSTLR